MKKTLVVALALALNLSPPAAFPAPEAGKVSPGEERSEEDLARVNGHVITRSELETFFTAFFLTDEGREQLKRLPAVQQEELRAEGLREALRTLIEQQLLLSEARKSYADWEAVQPAVEEMVAERLKELCREKGSMIPVVRSFHRRGIKLEEWKALMADVIVVQNYLVPTIRDRVHIKPSELRPYYEERRERFRLPRRIFCRVILVDPAGCETGEQERAKASRILEKIRGGADFGAMAEEHSLDRDRTEGGLRVMKAPADSPDWVPPLCRGLNPGELSGVQETAAGFCITRLEKIEPGGVPPFEEVQAEVRSALLERKLEQERRRLIERLRRAATIQYFPAGRQVLK